MSASIRSSQRSAFTLVELLVVIGIISVLVSILLPALNRARRSAVAVTCASNLKQLGNAVQLYLTDNKGSYPPRFSSGIGPVTGDWNGATDPDLHVSWDDLLGKYDGRRLDQVAARLSYAPKTGADRIWNCGADDGVRVANSGFADRVNQRSYGINTRFVSVFSAHPSVPGKSMYRPLRTNMVKRASETILMFDFPVIKFVGSPNDIYSWLGARDYGDCGQASGDSTTPSNTLWQCQGLGGMKGIHPGTKIGRMNYLMADLHVVPLEPGETDRGAIFPNYGMWSPRPERR